MAGQKKKKKKKTGARRPTYAKGRKVEDRPDRKGSPSAAGAKATAARAKGPSGTGEGERPQWNLIRSGSLEMKVFLTILVIIAIATIFQYPLFRDVADDNYRELKKKYPGELEKWEEKYKTDKEKKEHSNEKPVKPRRPTFGDFIIYQALMFVLQGAVFAFVGLNAARRTDLKTPIMDRFHSGGGESAGIKGLVAYGVPWGAATLAPLVISSVIAKYVGTSKTLKMDYDAWKNSLYFISINIQQQVMFLLLLMSSMVWIFTRYRDRLKFEPHLAAIAASYVLAFLYYFNISWTGGDRYSVGIQASAFLAFSLVGILGYLYWKKGLEYSLLAGVIGFGLYPFVAGLII